MPALDPRPAEPRRPLSRRALAGGVAWAVPAAALATAAPAIAASCDACEEDGGVLGDYQYPGTYTLTIPSCVQQVQIEVVGASGGTSGVFGGGGAKVTGLAALPAGSTTLTVVVGAAGRKRGIAMDDASYPWSEGYGRGGDGGTWLTGSGDRPVADGGGGGGGSAILLGDTPVAVAGGGGGGGNALAYSGGNGSSGSSGRGGVAALPQSQGTGWNSRDGEDGRAYGSAAALLEGGDAAVGATGGAASTLAQPPESSAFDRGAAGEDHGPGGGDGGRGGTGNETAPGGGGGAGGGGGGYAGGSGGDAGDSRGFGHDGSGGSGGGAGSSYDGGGGGITLSGTAVVGANNNAGATPPPTDRDGWVTITCVA